MTVCPAPLSWWLVVVLLLGGACIGVAAMCLVQMGRERPAPVFPTAEESEL